MSADAFPLEPLEGAFCHSVVMAATSPAHARRYVVTGQEPLPFVTRKLAALVRMNDEGLGLQRQMAMYKPPKGNCVSMRLSEA